MALNEYPQIRYCFVRKGTKKPYEEDWTNKPHTLEEVERNKDDNYGVLCGYGDLIVIDSDRPELQIFVESSLPDTFKVKTGRGGTHNYYFCKDYSQKVELKTETEDNKEIHWGEIQGRGSQVIGPGCLHPSGNYYVALNDNPISEITYQQLLPIISNFKTFKDVKFEENLYSKKDNKYDFDGLSVLNIWGSVGLKRHGTEYYGPHPVHGSDGGANFWVNPLKNTWHCFRCDSGGGPLLAIAVKEGIISCSDAVKGMLRGDKFKETIEKAKENYGLVEINNEIIKPKEEFKNIETEELNIWKYKDFEKLKKDKNFLVESVIYPKTVTMLYSPPGEFKSLLGLYLGMSVACGKEWMRFRTKKFPVLYCDKENNDQILKERLMKLYKGNNHRRKDFPIYILRRYGDLLDEKFVNRMKQFIEKYKIKLVVFDTLHRFAEYDENLADDINKLYMRVFQPLIENYGVSIIYLHHSKKDGGYRGSSDLLGFVDTAYSILRGRAGPRKLNVFKIINEKSRSGEIESISGQIDFGEDYIKIMRVDEKQDEEVKVNKIKELTNKVKSLFKEGVYLQKKDIEAKLEIEDYKFSVSTLKRCLNWLVDNGYLDRDLKKGYFVILR